MEQKIKTFSFEELLQKFPLLLEKVDRLETLLSKTTSPEPEEKLLTRKETADFLGISIGCLSNWEKSGKISAVGIGGKRWYRKSDLLNNELIKIQKS